jgi:hypothetical protein
MAQILDVGDDASVDWAGREEQRGVTEIDRLLAIASEATFASDGDLDERLASYRTLMALLWRRNGFVAFESALEVFGLGDPIDGRVELLTWNFSESSWRRHYAELPDDLIAFAQDVFGVQFLMNSGDAVYSFQPETGAIEAFADNLEGWASTIMSDYALHTGWPLAHAWQAEYGALRPGYRLVPRTPFIFDGAYELENLRAVSSADAMRLYCAVCAATHGIADGEKIDWSDPLGGESPG